MSSGSYRVLKNQNFSLNTPITARNNKNKRLWEEELKPIKELLHLLGTPMFGMFVTRLYSIHDLKLNKTTLPVSIRNYALIF